MNIQLFFTSVLCLGFTYTSRGQTAATKQVNHQFQSWFSINTTAQVTNKWGFIADAHIRRNNGIKDGSFYFLRGGLAYWLNPQLTAVVGYGHMWVTPSTPGWRYHAQENRLYQQIQYSQTLGKLKLLQRLRNEQRWQQIIKNDAPTGANRFTNRIRYLLSGTLTVHSNKRVPQLVVANEICLHMGKDVVYNTFEQNRIFIGIRHTVSPTVSFDAGYMYLYQQKLNGFQYDANHTLRWFFYYTPKFKGRTSPSTETIAGEE
ncbi:MAG: DUF2490 domain-containing protein [Bacteroidetes bacterium]|nr:MAG: DUF2490 domain-containing protein [Bacteroidota bacterium]